MALLDFLKRKKDRKSASEKPKKFSDKNQKKPEKKSVEASDVLSNNDLKNNVSKKISAEGGPATGGEPKEKKETGTATKKTGTTKRKSGKFSYDVIRQPHISEKASYLAEKNQYTFEISLGPKGYPNKNEIKNAIEGLYKVDVLSVNMIKIPAKKRRLGKIEGFRKAYKKAVVKIKEGQKIEIL